MTNSLNPNEYLVGVDGGGTGTRVVLADASGVELARATSGPSGLGLGVAQAWQAIETACSQAFRSAGVPFRDPDRLITVGEGHHKTCCSYTASYPDFQDWTRDAKSFESLAGHATDAFTVTGNGEPKTLFCEFVKLSRACLVF